LYERFFEEVGKPVDLEAEAAAEHGIEIPAP
jgi:hypothetical protein